ncbi:MAG: hypothetical protein ABWZ78_13935 [Burkholderiaceae bacterium]
MSNKTSTTPTSSPTGQRQSTQSGGPDAAPEHQTQDDQFQDTVPGDGNYQAARDYQRDAKDFAESGKVDETPRAAQPESGQQARKLEQAETARPERAKK